MSEIHVSPIDGDNALLVNGFVITIEIINYNDGSVIVYRVWRKDIHIRTYTTIQEAVEWCRD